MNLVKRWAILALAFWLTTFIVSGIQIQSGAWNYFWVAALFGVINTVLGGLLKLFTLPPLLTVVLSQLFSVLSHILS